MTAKSYADVFIPAKLIENGNPSYNETSQTTRIEWWADVSFVVDQAGLPQDIEFINISAKAINRAAVEAYIKKLVYIPATYNAKPVFSNKTFFFQYDISFYGSANDGVSTGFRKNYNVADKLVVSDKFEDASKALVILENKYAKNLSEQALTSWLKSVYFYKISAWKEYGDEVEKAFLLKKYLPKELMIKVVLNSIDIRVFKKQYSSALIAATELKQLKGISNPEEAYQIYHQQILADLEQHTKLEKTYILRKDLSHYILINRADVSLTVNTGTISHLELRCSKRQTILQVGNEVSFSLSEDGSKCALIVKGIEGTEFAIREQGNILVK